MSEAGKIEVGRIGWTDLTVRDAEAISEFYGQVVGWKSSPVDMNGYSDFNMNTPESGQTVAGVCHARGNNAKIPAQWMLYITVEDLDRSMKCCTELGGTVLVEPRGDASSDRFCVIQDPAGAVAALYQHAR